MRRLISVLFLFLLMAWSITNITASSKYSSQEAIKKQRQSNMWKLIAKSFKLNHHTNMPQVQAQIKWYQAHPEFFKKIARYGQPYIYYIYQQVQDKKLPGELVLLPMIESTYDPFAYSWVGAAGLWQMMPQTASHFGVKQDWWYDGRKDIVASTQAALSYILYLDAFFNGNWPQILAAYDAGEGSVSKAMAYNAHHNRSTQFWDLNLPSETETYVPRLLALAAIISNPKHYGVVLPPLSSGQYFQGVHLKKPVNLSTVAKLAGIPLKEVYQLNPGVSHWQTDPKGTYELLLPVGVVDKFTVAYGKTKNSKANSLLAQGKFIYRVKSGDTLSSIAKEYRTTVKRLCEINHITPQSILRLDQSIVIHHPS